MARSASAAGCRSLGRAGTVPAFRLASQMDDQDKRGPQVGEHLHHRVDAEGPRDHRPANLLSHCDAQLARRATRYARIGGRGRGWIRATPEHCLLMRARSGPGRRFCRARRATQGLIPSGGLGASVGRELSGRVARAWLVQAVASRSSIRSRKPPQPSVARSYCSGDIDPRCSKSISVRPSPRGVSTTVTSSKASLSG